MSLCRGLGKAKQCPGKAPGGLNAIRIQAPSRPTITTEQTF